MSPPALPHPARGPVRGTQDLGHPRPILTVPPHWLRRAHTANHETHFAFFFFFPPIFCFSTPFVVFPSPFPKAKAVFLLPLLLATLHPSCQDVSRAVRICCCGSSTEQEQKGKAVAGTSSFFKEKNQKTRNQVFFLLNSHRTSLGAWATPRHLNLNHNSSPAKTKKQINR